MSFRRHFTLGWSFSLGVISFLSGIGALLLFLSVNSTGWKSISLLFAVAGILLGIFRLLNFFFISLPEGHSKRMAISTGIFSGAIYYLLYGQSIIWTALSWLLLFYGVGGLFTAFQRILVEKAMLRALIKAYKKERLPNLPVPFVYVLAEPGWVYILVIVLLLTHLHTVPFSIFK